MSHVLRLAALACGYLVAAGLTVWLTRFNGGVAFVWIATAILTSYLTLTPRKDWFAALVICWVASIVATAFLGLGPKAAPYLATVNIVEAVIAAVLLPRWISRPGDFASLGEVTRFAVIVGLVAPGATAPAGALIAAMASGSPFLPNVLAWITGHALGALTVLPFALLVGRGELKEWMKGPGRNPAEAALLCAAMVATAVGVFAQTSMPLLFLPLLPALFATFRLGRVGAAISILTLIAVGAPFTVHGLGPLSLVDGGTGFRTQFFQFYIAVVVLTVLPAAAELHNRKRLFSALLDSEARYRLLAENTTDLIVLSDLDTTRRYVSPASLPLLGYRPEELVGTKPLDFVHPDDRAGYGELLAALGDSRIDRATTRQRYRRKDGAWIWLEVSFSLTRDPAGVANGYVASLRDVTERWKAEDALRVSEERLALALDSGSDGVWDLDIATGHIELSASWFATLGYDPSETPSRAAAIERLVHPDDLERSRRLLTDHLKGLTPVFECEYRLRTKDRGWAWTLARGKVVTRANDGRALRVVGTHFDITRRKQAELQVEHMAHHDALTGLPNRVLFRDRLIAMAMRASREGHQLAVLACDLDRFKAVNDTRGHAAGDVVLQAVAERLLAATRKHDCVARLGGDEFAIVLERIYDREEAARVARRVIELVGQPIEIEGQFVTVGASIGVAIGEGDPADQIFQNADVALYEAKARGRNVFSFFEQGMDTAFIARSQMEVDLQSAVRENALALSYQPIVNATTGKVCSFEALLRWPHPTRGLVPPAVFVQLAEETGLIAPLGAWALGQACREATRWPSDVRVAVNVSAVQFQRSELEQSVFQALEESGLAPHRLELEITESVLMQDAVRVVSSLMRLRAAGVRIALDDFGTGYSSLSYLRRFPFNKIKIDRSFIVEIEDPEVAAIVRAIVGLAERSGAAITAEGVETERQLERVREEGCTEVQGFLYSEPLTAEEALALLTRERGAAAQPPKRSRKRA